MKYYNWIEQLVVKDSSQHQDYSSVSGVTVIGLEELITTVPL